MATPDQATKERNALLDELGTALEAWYSKEAKAITKEAQFLRAVVRGRSGAVALSKGNVTKAKVLVIDDITSFLAGI